MRDNLATVRRGASAGGGQREEGGGNREELEPRLSAPRAQHRTQQGSLGRRSLPGADPTPLCQWNRRAFKFTLPPGI